MPIDGLDDPAVFTLRNAGDTERLLAAVDGPVVVVGSGFVGCEAAASLRRRARDVTVVSQEPAPQSGRLGEAVGALIAGWLRDSGISLHAGTEVEGAERHGDAMLIALSSGTTIEAAAVVLAVELRLRVGLAASIGLSVDDASSGVAVSPTMRTAADGVFAVGDIAAAWHPIARRHLRVEHWGDAEAHGATAGRRARRSERPVDLAAWLLVDDRGRDDQTCGVGDGYDTVHVERSASGETFWYGRDGLVVGVLTHGNDEDAETAAAAVAGPWPMPG